MRPSSVAKAYSGGVFFQGEAARHDILALVDERSHDKGRFESAQMGAMALVCFAINKYYTTGRLIWPQRDDEYYNANYHPACDFVRKELDGCEVSKKIFYALNSLPLRALFTSIIALKYGERGIVARHSKLACCVNGPILSMDTVPAGNPALFK
jgi:hypothetical protein